MILILIIILLCSPKPADNTKEAKESNPSKKANAKESINQSQSKLTNESATPNFPPSIP